MRLFVSLALFFLADAFELGDVAEFSTPGKQAAAAAGNAARIADCL